MKRILLFLFCFVGSFVANAQYPATGLKQQFKNGIALGSRDSTAFGANDSLVVSIDRNGKMIFRGNGVNAPFKVVSVTSDTAAMLLPYLRKSDTASMLAPYVRSSSLGIYLLKSDSLSGGYTTWLLTKKKVDSLGAVKLNISDTAAMLLPYARTSSLGSYLLKSDSLSGGYTTWLLTKKKVDSLGAVKLNISDTAAMLSPYVRTSGLGSYLLKSDSLSGGYTTWLLTKKKIDSLGAVKLNVLDTAAMLANRLKISDTAYMLSGYARTGNIPSTANFVPYDGATRNVNLGTNRVYANDFSLRVPSTSADTIGRFRWNADDLTANLGLTSSVVLQTGQELLVLVKNQTGVTIPNGTVVRQSGVVGSSGRLLVEPFLANGQYNSNRVLGITTEDIADGADGFVTSYGKVNGVNTAAYPDSTILYASPTVAGGLTATPPTAPNNIVKIGTVVKSANPNGIILTRIVYGSNINQDEGVQLTNPLNSSLLVYDSVTTLWKNKTLVEIGALRVQDSTFTNGYTTRLRTKQIIDSLGAVKLNISDTAAMLAGYKTYYPRTAISLTTTGSSGAATYNNATGVLNIPQYAPDLSGYVPYTGAVDNVNLGNFRLTARSLRMDSVYANGSGGVGFYTNSGTKSFSYGAGGSTEVTFHGFAGYDANRSASYTTRSFTDKGYVDSADALRLLISDTAAMLLPYLRKSDTATMLAPFVQYSDTTGLYSQVVRTFGTQTVEGAKTFSSALVGNSTITGVGIVSTRSAGSQIPAFFPQMTTSALNDSSVVMLGRSATNTYNLFDFTMQQRVANQSTGSLSVNLFDNGGKIRLQEWTRDGTTITRPLTINGNLTATNIIRSGGTSSQFLKADGSVDGTSYATAASISGTTNYIPKFTSASAIGNSQIQDDGTNVGIGGSGVLKFDVIGNASQTTTVGGATVEQVTLFRPSNGVGGIRSGFNTSSGNAYLWSSNSGSALYLGTRSAPNNNVALGIFADNTITAYGALNGTSLSMSGGAAFNTTSAVSGYALDVRGATNKRFGVANSGSLSGASVLFYTDANAFADGYLDASNLFLNSQSTGAVLINTTTTDGTNKLIVNGGVKANNSFQAFGYTNLPSTGSVIGMGFTGGVGYIQSWSNNAQAPISIDGSSFQVRLNNYATTAISLAANTGAATFSSSVTAAGFTTTAGSLITFNGASTGTNSYYPLNRDALTTEQGFFWRTNNVQKWFLGQRSFNSEDGFSLFSSALGANVMYFAPAGAATFSSSVTANTNTTIGNSNPVYNGNSGTSLSMLSSNSSWLELATGTTTDGNGGIITFNNTNIAGADKRMAAIAGVRDGANNSGALSFSTWNAGSAAERLRIAPSGAATFSSTITATGATLDRTTTGSNYLNIKALNSASNDIAVYFGDGTNNVYAGMMRGTAGSSDAAFHVFTGGAIRLTVASTGAATFSSSVTATSFIGSVGTDFAAAGGVFSGTPRVIRINIGGVFYYFTAYPSYSPPTP